MKPFLPILLVAVAAGLFYTFIDPTYKLVQEITAEEKQYNDALEKLHELQDIRDSLLVKYNSFSDDDLERLNKMLPSNVDNVRLALDISSIASGYNMRIKNISVNESPTATRNTSAGVLGSVPLLYESVEISFSVASTYDNLVAFLLDLERSLRIIDITHLSFSSIGNGDLNEYDISFKTYWRP